MTPILSKIRKSVDRVRGKMGMTCAVHRHWSYIPMEVHHIRPLGRGGRDTKDNRITVCSNGHSAIHELLTKVEKAGTYDGVPGSVRRRYGWKIRRLVRQGWEQYGPEKS